MKCEALRKLITAGGKPLAPIHAEADGELHALLAAVKLERYWQKQHATLEKKYKELDTRSSACITSMREQFVREGDAHRALHRPQRPELGVAQTQPRRARAALC